MKCVKSSVDMKSTTPLLRPILGPWVPLGLWPSAGGDKALQHILQHCLDKTCSAGKHPVVLPEALTYSDRHQGLSNTTRSTKQKKCHASLQVHSPQILEQALSFTSRPQHFSVWRKEVFVMYVWLLVYFIVKLEISHVKMLRGASLLATQSFGPLYGAVLPYIFRW